MATDNPYWRIPLIEDGDRGQRSASFEDCPQVKAALACLHAFEQSNREELSRARSTFRRGGVAGLVLIGLAVFLYSVGPMLVAVAAASTGLLIAAFGAYRVRRPPELTVSRAWKLSPTFGAFPFDEDRTLVTEMTGALPRQKIEYRTLPTLDEAATLAKTFTSLSSDLPAVETEEPAAYGPSFEDRASGLEGTVLARLDRLADLTDPANVERKTVRACLVSPSDRLSTLVWDAFEGQDAEPTSQADEENVRDAWKTAEELRGMLRHGGRGIDTVEAIEEALASSIDPLLNAYEDSHQRGGEHLDVVRRSLLAHSYTACCPACWEDGMEDSEMQYDLQADEWTCPVCEATVRPPESTPQLEHVLHRELLDPIWESLWTEKKDRRDSILHDIEDDLRDLRKEKEEAMRELERDGRQRIRETSSRLREHRQLLKQDKATYDALSKMFRRHELIEQQRLDRYDARCEEINREIQRKYSKLRKTIGKIEDEKLRRAKGDEVGVIRKGMRKAWDWRQNKRLKSLEGPPGKMVRLKETLTGASPGAQIQGADEALDELTDEADAVAPAGGASDEPLQGVGQR